MRQHFIEKLMAVPKMFVQANDPTCPPRYMTAGAAGMDLTADLLEPVCLHPGQIEVIPTGIRVAIPEGHEGQVRGRSGLAMHHGIGLVNGVGTIDSDYRGEILVILINHGREKFVINPGDRIAQLVISPVARVQILLCPDVRSVRSSERDLGGFGSTGVN